MYGYLKRQTEVISYQKTWICLRKGNLKSETEYLPMAAPKNDIRIHYVKTKRCKSISSIGFVVIEKKHKLHKVCAAKCRRKC